MPAQEPQGQSDFHATRISTTELARQDVAQSFGRFDVDEMDRVDAADGDESTDPPVRFTMWDV